MLDNLSGFFLRPQRVSLVGIAAAKIDGGAGAITVEIDGEDVTCYVTGEDETIQNAIKATAESYRNEFPGESLDSEWSETAYADLSSNSQKQLSWREFHDAVAEKVEA